MNNYDNLFKLELGIYKNEKIYLEIGSNISPICHKPQQIPFTFREKVISELARLEN